MSEHDSRGTAWTPPRRERPGESAPLGRAVIVAIDIPFGDLVGFVVKLSFALLVASLLLGALLFVLVLGVAPQLLR